MSAHRFNASILAAAASLALLAAGEVRAEMLVTTQPRAGVGFARTLPQLHKLPRLGVLQQPVVGAPVTLPCLMRGGALVWIENATGMRLPKGTPVDWQTSAGEKGTAPLPSAIDPNLPIGLVQVNDAQSCTAQVVPPSPGLAQ